MGWSIGYDEDWDRDIGYGVPAYCDHPKCSAEIDRGLSYRCGGYDTWKTGDRGCCLYFCGEHLTSYNLCPRCAAHRRTPYARPKPEHPRWMRHVLTHESWAEWRGENPKRVAEYERALAALPVSSAAAGEET